MKVLIVNAILYTSESKEVRKVKSIKDCMIYDLCRAFHDKGHDVTLIAAYDYKPTVDEKYPFRIVWMKSRLKKIFMPNKIPYNRGIKKYLKDHHFDLVICSEVFSLDTLLTVRSHPENLIIWQEMAFHQKMAKQMASKFWHNVILKMLYPHARIVARTQNAKAFISKYCDNVSEVIIPHGVDLDKFVAERQKDNYFIVVSQLIERKQIDRIILAFRDFCKNTDTDYKLYIAGDGDKKTELENIVKNEKLEESVTFTGQMKHDEIVGLLSKARAMLVYTKKDNSMISIAESLAVCTPVITTPVPDNARSIKDFRLGVVKGNWTWEDLKHVAETSEYVENCYNYRNNLDNKHNVDLFINEIN